MQSYSNAFEKAKQILFFSTYRLKLHSKMADYPFLYVFLHEIIYFLIHENLIQNQKRFRPYAER